MVDGSLISVLNGGSNIKLSASNVLKGKVKSIVTGMGSSEIITELPEATEITSIITKTLAENLNLKIGKEIYAAFKALSVMIATD